MNEEELKQLRENVDSRVEESYQEYLKEKLDLVFSGVDGKKCKNTIGYKTISFHQKKWKVEKLEPEEKEYLEKKFNDRWGMRSFRIISDFHNGVAVVNDVNAKVRNLSLIDRKGELITWLNSYHAFYGEVLFADNCIILADNHRFTISDGTNLDKIGDLLYYGKCTFSASKLGEFRDGYALVDYGSHSPYGGYNFVSTSGQMMFKYPLFFSAWEFHEGLARVATKNGHLDYIDTNGNLMYGKWGQRDYGRYHDEETFAVPEGDVPFEDGGDFHDGYARVMKNGKWNYIDHDGKPVLKEWYDEVSDVELGRAKVKKDGVESYHYFGMGDYKVKKTLFGYECYNEYDSYRIKYQPVKRFDMRYTLCVDKKNNYLLYDTALNQYRVVGKTDEVFYDDNFIFDGKNERMYMIYNDNILDITDYYNEHLKDKDEITISTKVPVIMTRESFEYESSEKIDEIIAEERKKNIKIKEDQSAERDRQKLIESKKEEDRKENERKANLKKLLEQLKVVLMAIAENSGPNDEITRLSIAIPYDTVDDHLEIPKELLSSLKYIDLGGLKLDNVKLSGIDFRGCNAGSINPQVVYNRDLSGCNFEGICFLPSTNFDDVDITGSSFSEDGDPKTMDMSPTSFANAIYDETTKYNGVPLEDIIGKCKRNRSQKK